MKMDSFDTEKDYGTIISTVVNNRADRVSRSRVFAQIIAEELSADYHFLVGTNLEGISGYIKKVWRSSLKSFSHATEEEVVELFERKATFLRIPSKETILKNKLKLIMTSNSEIKSLEASEAYKKMVQTYNEYIELKKELSSSLLPINKLAEKCKKLLTHWFYDKIIMLHNPKINGEEIIKHIEAKTPPYHKNIIMGIQNIKGPGINLINTWKRLESSASDIQLKTPNSQQCPVNFIGKGALKCYSMAKTLIEPFSSIAKQRNAKSIYKAIVSGTISSFKAIKELKKLRD
jgi:hypothetical protein